MPLAPISAAYAFNIFTAAAMLRCLMPGVVEFTMPTISNFAGAT
jgi:hypothetical protein